jgi:hypothetical protein
MTLILLLIVLPLLAWFLWPVPAGEFEEYGWIYGLPVYVNGSYTESPTLAGRTRGIDWLVGSPFWMDTAATMASLLGQDTDVWPIKITGPTNAREDTVGKLIMACVLLALALALAFVLHGCSTPWPDSVLPDADSRAHLPTDLAVDPGSRFLGER